MMNDLRINNEITLTKSSYEDKDALVSLLNDEEIHKQTLRIPFPYTEKDALANIAYNLPTLTVVTHFLTTSSLNTTSC